MIHVTVHPTIVLVASVMQQPFNQGAVLAIPRKNFKHHLIICSPRVNHV